MFSDELTGEFDKALENASVDDFGLLGPFAGNWSHAIFGVLQHYQPENGHRGVLREDLVPLTHPTLRRAQSLVAARDRSFQSLPCFCQFIRIWRFCGVFLPSANSCSPTKLKRTMAAGPTMRIVGSLYSSEVHL